MILVAVGTFHFDELVEAADRAATALDLSGMAQIGHGSFLPSRLEWARILPLAEFQQCLAAASLVVCHGGIGILGDAMRAARPIMAVPRRGPVSASNPANDQLELLRKLATRYPIHVCEDPIRLKPALRGIWGTLPERVDYRLGSDIPQMLADFLLSSKVRRAGLVGNALAS
jgi:UDP-N-acetylglucosamine transferase subunit ALG13